MKTPIIPHLFSRVLPRRAVLAAGFMAAAAAQQPPPAAVPPLTPPTPLPGVPPSIPAGAVPAPTSPTAPRLASLPDLPPAIGAGGGSAGSLDRVPAPGGSPAGGGGNPGGTVTIGGSDGSPGFTLTVDPALPPPTPSIVVGSGMRLDRAEPHLARAMVSDDLQANPLDAVRNYEAIIADFDRQRETAAHAIYRLAEAYRKVGRLDEARVQYARILREFVDFPDLSRPCQAHLAQVSPRASAPLGGTSASPIADEDPLSSASEEEERKLLDEEIALLKSQLDQAQQLFKSGTVSESALVPIQREILQLKRQRLHRAIRSEGSPRQVPALPAGTSPPSDADPLNSR